METWRCEEGRASEAVHCKPHAARTESQGQAATDTGDKCNRLIYVGTWLEEQVADWDILVSGVSLWVVAVDTVILCYCTNYFHIFKLLIHILICFKERFHISLRVAITWRRKWSILYLPSQGKLLDFNTHAHTHRGFIIMQWPHAHAMPVYNHLNHSTNHAPASSKKTPFYICERDISSATTAVSWIIWHERQ